MNAFMDSGDLQRFYRSPSEFEKAWIEYWRVAGGLGTRMKEAVFGCLKISIGGIGHAARRR